MDLARDFTNRLLALLDHERAALGDFLLALSEFDERRLWAELGYASLFDFLHRELRLSRGAAFYRKTAVDLVRRYPQIVEPLRRGDLCLMTVAEVSKVLTPENRAEVLPRFYGLSKREAQALAAELQPDPSPPVRDAVTPVRVARAEPAPALVAPAAAGTLVLPVEPVAGVPVLPVEPVEPRTTQAGAASTVPAPPPKVEPLTASLDRLHVTISKDFMRKLDAARAALSHSHPGAGAAEILEAGLDLLLDRHARRRGLVKKPRAVPPPSSNPDRIPAHVRREVWTRDGGRCQWRLASGEICGSTHRVQLDHRVPKARGGLPTVEGLRCLCQAHNLEAARLVFGDAWMDGYAPRRRGGPGRAGRGAPGPAGTLLPRPARNTDRP